MREKNNSSIDEHKNGKSSCCSSIVLSEKGTCTEPVLENDNSFKHEHTNIEMLYRVYGLDCAACAKSVEKGVSQLPQIEYVQVNFSTGKMKVYSNSLHAFTPIDETVERLGYRIERINSNNLHLDTYQIEGLDCSSCAKSLENHLMSLSDVSKVQVNFSTGKMKIAHMMDEKNLFAEVEKIGYKAISPKKEKESKKVNKESTIMMLSTVLIAVGFISTFLNIPEWIPNGIFALVIFLSGFKPLRSAFFALKSKSLDMNVLMSGAAIGAMLIGEWFEGATVVWLFAIGSYLQTRSIEKTRQSISCLMDLAPAEAWVNINGKLVKKDVADITVSDHIMILPGEKIPLDGEIVKGESSVNQAPITGESIPVDKQIGDLVYAGTMNEHGTLEIKVTKIVEDTTIARIIHLVEEAQEKKAPTEAFVDKFASIYTPIVFVTALLLMVIPPLLNMGSASEWFYKGLELLVVACPCALVISTPVAIVSAIGNAARNGVLIKGGTFLEIAGKVDAVAFDKTGTLTKGKPAVSDIFVYDSSKEDLLAITYTLEEYSTHPIAKAVTNFALKYKSDKYKGTAFKNIVGKGVKAEINGDQYYAGNVTLFQELGVSIKQHESVIETLQAAGKTIVLIGTSEKMIGLLAVADQIRSETLSMIEKLKATKIQQTIMLTGDNEGAAQQIAKEAHVDRYIANLLPEQKVKAVQKLQQEGFTVAMIGDGINDAPALATANLGIAMGGAGTDTAMETADIVLMADNLEKLPHTMKLSNKALSIIKQNIIFSIIVKLVALIMIFPGWLTLWMAVLSDTGAALLVILNSLRLLRFKSEK